MGGAGKDEEVEELAVGMLAGNGGNVGTNMLLRLLDVEGTLGSWATGLDCVILILAGAPNVWSCAWRSNVGTLFVLLRREASKKIALPVASPAAKEGIIGLGGFFEMATMSKADCFKKSFKLTSGKLIDFGKKRTVSASISTWVEGMKHLTHR